MAHAIALVIVECFGSLLPVYLAWPVAAACPQRTMATAFQYQDILEQPNKVHIPCVKSLSLYLPLSLSLCLVASMLRSHLL